MGYGLSRCAAGGSIVYEVEDLLEVFPGLAFGVLIVRPQQERWMVRHHHRDIAPLKPLPAHLGDTLFVAGNGLSGGPTEDANGLGRDGNQLAIEKLSAD